MTSTALSASVSKGHEVFTSEKLLVESLIQSEGCKAESTTI
jgi:hypothetical protein